MALHLSGKLSALGIVVALLITAFSAPRETQVSVAITPVLDLLAVPRMADLSTPVGPTTEPRFTLIATGYNSIRGQTDSSPHTTSTGTRTRFGIIAVSRDLLSTQLPYGSLVRIRDLGEFSSGRGAGDHQELLDDQNLFVVEDTMHARKRKQIDVWFEDRATAVNWGVRQVEVELVRFGWNGPLLTSSDGVGFDATPRLARQ